MARKTLPSGLDVDVLGRCTDGSFCSETATHYVEYRPRPDYAPLHPSPPLGLCQRHVEARYVSDEEYKRLENRSRVSRRSDYVIRPLTDEEAAEVAHEKSAPERWEAEGTIGAFRRVAEMYSAEEVDGVLIDAFSAQHVVQVYDALNEKNKARMAAMDVVQIVDITFKLVSSQR
ncbi:hypothetical protein [Streptomyces sp. NPDC088360]|uniref:hypothetical protein n=1 Tax=Streptomyces sp. NPDC088360 TaxID=3154515 RepID=UPI00344F3715